MLIYYVEELVAALIIFSVVFVILIVASLIVLVLDCASQIAFVWGMARTTNVTRALFRLRQPRLRV